MSAKITIAIPSHNNEDVIEETIQSVLSQEYHNKEILIIDDASTDNTVNVIMDLIKKSENREKFTLIINQENLGIGKNLEKLMIHARGEYIVYLCADDVFANNKVVGDIVDIFEKEKKIGIVGRYFYFFRHGYKGAIGVSRETDIFIQSCCPSGMAFRVDKSIVGYNDIFVEMPKIVKQYLNKGYGHTMIKYDTVGARFHPGGNTGTKKSYYTQSPTKNWIDLVGKEFKSYETFIMLRNRATEMLWNEIKIVFRNNNKCLRDLSFWFYASIAVIFPGWILRPLTNFYRHRIARRFSKVIERGYNE